MTEVKTVTEETPWEFSKKEHCTGRRAVMMEMKISNCLIWYFSPVILQKNFFLGKCNACHPANNVLKASYKQVFDKPLNKVSWYYLAGILEEVLFPVYHSDTGHK